MTTAKRNGVFGLMRRILDGGLALVEDRVELVAVEYREEKKRLIETVILAAMVIACGLMTVALTTLLVVIYFWENARLAALGGLGAFFLGVTVFAWLSLRRRLKKLPFSGTLWGFDREHRRRLDRDSDDL